MNTLKLSTKLVSLAVGAAFALGMASSASATPVFTFDPVPLVSSPLNTIVTSPFQASDISFNSSELISITNVNGMTASGSGWGVATSFSNNGVTLPEIGNPVSTGLGTGTGGSYGLYILFNLTVTAADGEVIGTPGSKQTVNTLTFTLYSGDDSGFIPASIVGGVVTPASTPAPNPADELGFGSIMSGSAGFNAGSNGAFLNSTETFTLTPFGSTVFTAPVPFFDLAFDEFNNTTQGATIGTGAATGSIAINATGQVDFNNVPEPASLALLGLGLIGLTFMRRKSS